MKRDLGKILDTKVAASQMWHPGCRNLCPTIWHNFWPPFSFLKLVPLKIQFTIWSPDLLVKGVRGTSVRVHIWRLIWNRQCHCFQNTTPLQELVICGIFSTDVWYAVQQTSWLCNIWIYQMQCTRISIQINIANVQSNFRMKFWHLRLVGVSHASKSGEFV